VNCDLVVVNAYIDKTRRLVPSLIKSSFTHFSDDDYDVNDLRADIVESVADRRQRSARRQQVVTDSE
jgi:hypothetical protein